MNSLHICKASTIQKYIKIICGILNSHNGMFCTYMHIQIKNKLRDIINMFKIVIGLPNICRVINGTQNFLGKKAIFTYHTVGF